MPGFFKSIGKFLTYKEPKNGELGFELLEGDDEGNESSPGSHAPASNKKRKERKVKTAANLESVPIQNWNSKRNSSPEESQDQVTDQTSWENNENPSPAKGNSSNGAPGGKGQSGGQNNNQNHNQTQQSSQGQSQTKSQQSRSRNGNQSGKSTENQDKPQGASEVISSDLCDNLEKIRQTFIMQKSNSVLIREFKIGRKIKAILVYVEVMIQARTLNLSILPGLMSKDIADEIGQGCPVDFIIENVLTANNVKKEKKYKEIIQQILSGFSAIFVDGCDECILIETKGYQKRSVNIPQTESIVKGSQEAFTEDLHTNLSLIRKIIRNEKLVAEMFDVGKTNNAKCAVLYIDGIADPRVISEVKKRINSINTDFIMGSGMIEQFIEDNPFMLFPQVMNSERPDRTVSALMQGQVSVLVEGSPFSISMPATFFSLLHTSEDSFARWPYGTFLRFLRMFGLFCATLLPGLYVAMIMFHPDVLPTELLISIAQARESVPFPTLVEVIIMELAFELIREGGIRVPSIIGQTLGIVGALILGQAAVSAGLVSPFVVIIVSVTALGSFVIPNYSLSLAIRIERFLFIFAGAFLGFYGVALVFFLLGVLACSMKSFGVPFFAPVAPKTRVNPDVIVSGHIWLQKNRPDYLQTQNRKRQGKNVKSWTSEEEGQESQGGGKQNDQ